VQATAAAPLEHTEDVDHVAVKWRCDKGESSEGQHLTVSRPSLLTVDDTKPTVIIETFAIDHEDQQQE